MKELVILSGKGGTGKTSLTAAFAALTENKVLCDADVDAADLHLLLSPEKRQETPFSGGGVAEIDPERCVSCGLCREICKWNAITEAFQVQEIDCEGCGLCHHFCPEGAIDFPEKVCGHWFVSDTRFGPMVHARLGIAEENSGKLVARIRKETRELAEREGFDLILTDGPPGVGCPVIASLSGADAVLVIAEPTVSGYHDLTRVIELTEHFKIPAMVCVNKYDLNEDKAREIEAFARKKGIPAIGKIPFAPDFTKSMVQGQTLMEYPGDPAVMETVREVLKRAISELENSSDRKRSLNTLKPMKQTAI